MLNTVSDAQRAMLQAAVEREDRLILPPVKARAATAKSLAAKLIETGWVREIKATNGAPVWRKGATRGEAFALKLTAKGFKALTSAREATEGESKAAISPASNEVSAYSSAQRSASAAVAPARRAAAVPQEELPATVARAPRADSKIGRVLDMLAADKGATIGDLTAVTGWLEHTTRAALTGLRRRGYVLTLTRNERCGASVYRIAAGGGEAAK